MNKGFKSFIEFTVAPLLIFVTALVVFLFFNWLFSKEKSTEKLLRELQTPMSRNKWQVAYDLAVNEKHLHFIRNNSDAYNIISGTLKKALVQYDNVPVEEKEDIGKFIEYMIYLLSYCSDNRVNNFFRENLIKKNSNFLGTTILVIGNTKRIELLPTILELYSQVPLDIQLKILFVSGILQTEEAKQLLLKEFQSINTLKKLNAAFALARMKEKIVLPYFEHLLRDDNYKKLEISDLEGVRNVNEKENMAVVGNILRSLRFFNPEEVYNFVPIVSEIETKIKDFTIRRLCKEFIFSVKGNGRK